MIGLQGSTRSWYVVDPQVQRKFHSVCFPWFFVLFSLLYLVYSNWLGIFDAFWHFGRFPPEGISCTAHESNGGKADGYLVQRVVEKFVSLTYWTFDVQTMRCLLNFLIYIHHHRIDPYSCSLHCPRRTVDKWFQLCRCLLSLVTTAVVHDIFSASTKNVYDLTASWRA